MTETRSRRLAKAYYELAEAEDERKKTAALCVKYLAPPTEIFISSMRFERDGGGVMMTPETTLLTQRVPEFMRKNWLSFIEFLAEAADERIRVAKFTVALIEAEINK